MDEAQRAAWDRFYTPIIDDFYKQNQVRKIPMFLNCVIILRNEIRIVVVTLPDNFFDDYEGRPAAAAQEMSIVKDMDMIYDLKMLRPDKKSRLKSLYEKYIGRMDEAQRAA